MKQQLIIPEKLKIGFNARKETYTGKLGFITYYLPDGTTKHKKSWDNWIEPEIPILEFKNIPTEGFILNRREGGGGRWSYDEREPKVRVWDPRGFEIEITIENMLDILAICGSYPGKGLEGNFIYSWDQKRLVLLPTISNEYKNSIEFTDLSDLKVEAKDLILGASYISKDQKKLIYLGNYPWVNLDFYSTDVKVQREYIFYEPNRTGQSLLELGNDGIDMEDYKESEFEIEQNSFSGYKITDIAKCTDPHPIENYAELIERMQKTGKYFTKEMLSLKKSSPVFNEWTRPQQASYGIYEGEGYDGNLYWIRKDENTYEGVRFRYTFPEISPNNRYNRYDAIANGIIMTYQKKLIISGDGIDIKKSSKQDKTIYIPSDFKDKEFFDLKLNASLWIKAEVASDKIRGYKRTKADIENYTFKQIR